MTTAWTPQSWAEELITDANQEAPSAPAIPIDANTVSDIEHWMPAEEPVGDWWDRNNPLNASVGTGSSDGTGSYKDLATGAYYTAGMIDQGNMSGIRAALAQDAAPSGFSPAVVASPWASGHYGGNPQAIASTSPGGGAAPSSAGSVGQVPSVDASALGALNTGVMAGAAGTLTGAFGIPGAPGFLDPSTDIATALGELWSVVEPFLVKGMLITTGLGLIVLGLYKTADGGDMLKAAAPEIAEAAAA